MPTHVKSGVFHFNKASLAIQKKLGFAEIGTSTLHLPCAGRGGAPYRHRTDARHLARSIKR